MFVYSLGKEYLIPWKTNDFKSEISRPGNDSSWLIWTKTIS